MQGIQEDLDTLNDSGSMTTVLIDSLIYLGSESVTVPAGTFVVSKVGDVNDITSRSNGNVFHARVRELTTLDFARSIGMYARLTFEHVHLDSTGTVIDRTLFTKRELLSYSIK
jgi:hypothetical protein